VCVCVCVCTSFSTLLFPTYMDRKRQVNMCIYSKIRYAIKHPMPIRLFLKIGIQCKNILR
jgi:hypothetical protein